MDRNEVEDEQDRILSERKLFMKRFYSISFVLVFIWMCLLLSGCVSQATVVTFNFDQHVDPAQVYLRFSDGTIANGTEKRPLTEFSPQVVTIQNSGKTIVGAFLSEDKISWVPSYSYSQYTVVVNSPNSNKPTKPADHVIQSSAVALADRPGYVSVTYDVYDAENMLLTDGQTEVFAHSDPNVTFYNNDSKDVNAPNYSRTDYVAGGFSSFTNQGHVTFVVQANSATSLPPITLYSGQNIIPYQIATADQLDAIRNNSGPNQCFKLTVDIDLSSYSSGEGWLPIGDQLNPFQGSIDGNGYKITGLTINRPGSSYVGLFGNLDSTASVTNMKLENVSVNGLASVGGLAGSSAGTISSSYVKGNVTGHDEDTGGLVGYNVSYGTISNSYAAVSVTSSTNNVGGLVGSNFGTIRDSYATGSVASSGYYIGGLVGLNAEKTIANSYATGKVSGSDYAGGLVGANGNRRVGPGTISNSFYDKGTTGQSDSGKGTGNPTEAMKSQGTYTAANWDFSGTWGMDASHNNGYPYLQAIQKFVIYNGNGNTGGAAPIDVNPYIPGATVSVLGNTGSLVRTGYAFSGWNTAADGSGTSYSPDTSITIGTANVTLYAQWNWLSPNALLSSLNVGQGTLKPAFSTTVTNYSVDVANSISSLNVSLMKAEPAQTLSVTGATYSSVSGNVYTYNASNLIVGSNPIQITVLAQNQSHNTYNLTVNRLSNNADLSGLTLSGVTLTPIFTSGTTSYSVNVANNVSSITVTASVYDSKATLIINGAAVASGQASSGINMNVGNNTITIVVMAQDGTTKTYTVTVTRAPAPSDSPVGGGSSSTPTSNTITSTDGTLTLPVGKSGEVSLGNEVKISIPADASGKDLKLTIEKVLDSQKLVTNKDVLVSPIFEILKNFSENFSKEITLTFAFDPKSLKDKQKASVFYYDETKKVWVEVGGEVNGNTINVKVNHFTKYAVFGVSQDAGTTGDAKQTNSFSDISGHWAESSIKQAVGAGIISGYPDGTFKPDHTVKRAEFAVMLMNAIKPQGDGAALTFSDKEKIGAWAQKSVSQAVYAGIISGYGDATFRPDAEITRPEMAVMIARATGQSIESNAATGFADEQDIPEWAKGAVAAMKKLGIIEGKGANEFAPDDKTTRAEAVTVLLKMLAHKGK